MTPRKQLAFLRTAAGTHSKSFVAGPWGRTSATARPKAPRRGFSTNQEVVVTDYFYAGTSKAYEHIAGNFSDVSCAACGAKISHIFMSNVGPLGGDCAATLTGDETTRSALRRIVPKALRLMSGGRVSTVFVRNGLIYGTLRGTGRVRESDGAVMGQKEISLGSVPSPKLGRMIAASLVERINIDEPGWTCQFRE